MDTLSSQILRNSLHKLIPSILHVQRIRKEGCVSVRCESVVDTFFLFIAC